MATPTAEPDDGHWYRMVFVEGHTVRFFIESLDHYAQLLEADLQSVRGDAELQSLLSGHKGVTAELETEASRVRRLKITIRQVLHEDESAPHILPQISHGTVRFIKSVGQLYVRHLRLRRDAVAGRLRISALALRALDDAISERDASLSIGIFAAATAKPLLVDDLASASTPQPTSPPSASPGPRPILVDNLWLSDDGLKSRCADLFDRFHLDGQPNRLDTVVSEATKVLEDRLRRVSGAPNECVGIDLAKFAFGLPSPVLRVSPVDAEQEAVHLLFRGVFGFIRNPAHHRINESLQPSRVLEVVGFIDYLLFLIQGAQVFRRDS